MKQSMKCAVAVMLSFLWMNAPAQFYTVQSVGRDADTLSFSTDPYASDVEPKAEPVAKAKEKKRFRLALPFAKLGTKPLPSNISQGKSQEKDEKSFSENEKKVEKQLDLLLLNTTDSLVVELIKKRITLCMPLDFVQINSQYGYRKDPFTRCCKFHDGIDLQGIHDLVYSMLPGRIVEVRHGNTGYGNYVVLDHGSLRCLYGHLSEIYAKEGSIVDAGTIVGRVGSTGRSTGTHLHIRLQHLDSKGHWQSVNPLPFIDALNQQVNEYNERINELTGRSETATPYNNKEYHSHEVAKLNHVSIRYGSRTILKELDWTVLNGERWALSGQNGAGKSTLLSLICADNPQSYACDIALFGIPRGSGESIWDIKKHIGYVSPEMHRAYQKDIPAIRIVASGLKDSVGLYAKPSVEEYETCRFWLDVFGLEGKENTTFLKLSSGEQRLVLLARAFVKDPELLILDEPLHGLDNNNRMLVKNVIDTFMQRENKTLIMVTHYEEELPTCIDHKIRLIRHS